MDITRIEIRNVCSFPIIRYKANEFFLWRDHIIGKDKKEFSMIKLYTNTKYNLKDTNERLLFWNDIKSQSDVDGLSMQGELCVFDSYETFSQKTTQCKDRYGYTINDVIWPFHIIRASEVEKFYEYTSSIVIKGIECDKYEDAGTVYCDYNYGYVDVLYSGKYEEITEKIPESDLKEVNIRMDSGRYYERKKLISKKYIDKIILRRKYLHPDLIEFCLEKFYTGEEDVYELDPKNPDPEILNMMVKYGVVLFYVDENQDTIKSVSSKRTLTIGGKEYDAVRNNEETIVLCHDLMTGYDLSSKSDIRKLYNDLKNNTFVHGICKETLYEDLSMEDFLTLMQTAKKEAEAKQVPLRQIVCPFHRVSQSEVEAFCEYESSIMMGEYYNKDSWVECKDFLDLNCQQPCFSETYPEYVSVDAESSEALCKTLADCYYKRITINDGENDRAREITIFKKSIVKQIKLYRRYLDASNIEHSLDAPYTGKEEEFVLNKSEIYPKDLELMKKYGVIVEKELK